MPRAPVRRRHLNRNGPISRRAKPIPSSSPAKRELEQKLAHKPIGARPNDSDDSDRLVVKGQTRRGRSIPRQEIYGSGAVGAGDKPGAYPSRAQRRQNMTRATKEILADVNQAVESRPGSIALDQPREKDRLSNNSVPTVASTARPPLSILRSTQPTPSRENSILGTLKPRRRQPSILQNLDIDSSTFDLEDEEDFLPDAESTPLNLSHLPSSSRKRKLGASDPLEPVAGSISRRRIVSSPLTTRQPSTATPDAALPTVPVSSLRKSGQEQRQRTREEEDILAPPESGSSPSSSPVRINAAAPRKTSKRKASKQVPVMTTEELQALVMPTKWRRSTRERSRAATEFDIPADSDSSDPRHRASDHDDESSFLPGRKSRQRDKGSKVGKSRNKAGVGGTKSSKPGKQAASGAATFKPKSSTKHLITTTTTAPILTPSTPTSSRRNRETKSPSQLSTVEASNMDPGPRGGHLEKEGGGRKRYGGSLRPRQGTADGLDKENLDQGPASDDSGYEHLGGGKRTSPPLQVPRDAPVKARSDAAAQGKWADIDAWEMDFEDVQVMTGSGDSSPLRR